MTKGSRRCCISFCRLQATGAVLHHMMGGGRFYGSHACQGHLEEAVQHYYRTRLYLPNLLLMAARGEIR